MGSVLQGVFGGTNDFQATAPDVIKQNGLLPQLAQGQTSFNANQANQGQLAQMLLAQSQGFGPNPAQNQLNQATNQNIQQAAGLVASQRGVNPAMAARMAGQQAASANQNAAGQAASMNAQQQLSARSQLGGLYGQMGTQNLQNQSIMQGALSNQNNATNAASLGSQQINAGVAGQNAEGANKWGIGLVNAGASAAGKAFGGEIEPASGFGKFVKNPMAHGGMAPQNLQTGGPVPGQGSVSGDSFANDTVPAMLSPKEIVLPRSVTMAADAPEKAAKFVAAVLAQKKIRSAK